MDFRTYLYDQAVNCKLHLEKYPAAIVEVYADEYEMEANKEVFLEVLGEQLYKRVNFFPAREVQH